MKLTIALEDVEQMLDFRDEINNKPLNEIFFTLAGEIVPISKKQIDDWMDTGLSNLHFIESCLLADDGDEDGNDLGAIEDGGVGEFDEEDDDESLDEDEDEEDDDEDNPDEEE